MTGRLPRIFILATVAIDAIGIGLILPVMPDLIAEVRGVNLAHAAQWGGILTLAYAAMQFAFSPLIGSLSDRFGRRPILLVSLAAMALDYVVMAVAGTIWLLVAGRVVAGIASATMSTAMAFMADISDPAKRAQNFGLVSAAFGSGFILGPIIGGLIGGIDPRAPFIVAAALAGANALFGLLVAPETLAPENRRLLDLRRANPLGGLLRIGALPGARRLLGVLFLYQIATWVYPAVWAYYTQARFGWDTGLIGASLTAYGLAMAVVQGGVIRIVLARLGEARATIWGMALNVACLVAYAIAPVGAFIWVLIPISALGSVVQPAMTGVLSRAAPADQQGELQGVLTSINGLAMIVSPVLMTQAFFLFTRADAPVHMPGAPFLLAAIMMAAGFALLVLGPRPGTARA
ncbi:MFS transporter [Rhodobacterales bacterium HKCCE3408]|nr:MFS transporter [Rhodobacterales bacterium HKCCE3408]